MKLSTCILTSAALAVSISAPALANDNDLPELLSNLSEAGIQHLSREEAADTRGESMRKEVSQYGFCGLRRCTRMFVNDKLLYTLYDDGSVYFVNH